MKIIAPTLRDFAAIVFLFLAGNMLTRWYAYQHPDDYALFAACFVVAIGLALYRRIPVVLNDLPRLRLAAAGGLLILALPWGEWLRLALPMAREDWSRQLFRQFCFIYGCLLTFRTLPALRQFLKDRTLALLEQLSSRRWVLRIIPVLFLVLSTCIVYLVFHKTLLIQDAAAHLFQAKIFHEGELFAPAPPFPDAFDRVGDMLVLRDGRWYSMYLPGFSLVLAAAMFVKAEWVVGPALGAATIAIWIGYVLRWHDRRTAIVLGVLCLLSPMLFLMFSSMMIHSAELFYSACVIYLCRLETEEPSTRRLLLLFLVVLMAMITRGFSFIPFVAPVIAWTLWKRVGVQFGRVAASISVAVLLGLVLIAAYQWKTTGHPVLAGYSLEYKVPQFYGFEGEILGQRHSPLRGLENVSNNLIGMNKWATGWPSGMLFFLFLFLLRGNRRDPWDIQLLLCCFFLALFYYFYIFQDLVIGPRFWFLMVPVLLLFVSRSFFIDPPEIRSYVIPLGVVSIAVYLVLDFPKYIRKYAPGQTQASQLHDEMARKRSHKTIALLDRNVSQQYVNWNDPFLRGNLVVCSDLGSRNHEILSSYPDYEPVYFREVQTLKKSALTVEYRFVETPDPNPRGYISLFSFALVVYSANSYVDDDLFDLCYTKFLAGDTAGDYLAFLDSLESQTVIDEPPVRTAMRSGLIHSARFILLPKLAYEQNGQEWRRRIDCDSIRREYQSASSHFMNAGDTGQTQLQQLQKIGIRIDRNSDGQFSDSEILRFLSGKMRYLELES